MKKIFAGLALMAMAAVASAQTITFDRTTYDYGTVKTGSDGHRYFVVKNTGDKPLIISQVTPSCGCTTPEWSKEPIMPGKTSLIKVGYGNMSVKGPWGPKTIEVFSNDPVNQRTTLYIKGNVDDAGVENNGVAPSEKEQAAMFKKMAKEVKTTTKTTTRTKKVRK